MPAFLENLYQLCSHEKLSDVIVQPGERVAYLKNHEQHVAEFRFEEDDVKALLTLAQLPEWPTDQRHALQYRDARFRGTFARSCGKRRAVLRLLPNLIPTPESLRIPKQVVDVTLKSNRGIVLVCGPTGSGKSTAMASLLQARAEKGEHIVTLEDPVEYEPKGKHPLQFFHREVGRGKDTESFGVGLTTALALAPRIIMVGEINDAITATTAINAAASGHLLFSTLHTGRVAESCESLMKFVPAPQREAAQFWFAKLLRAIVCMRLVEDGRGGRFAIHEVLMDSPQVAARINRGDFLGLDSEIEQGARAQHQSFKQSVQLAWKDNVISAEQRDVILNNYIA